MLDVACALILDNQKIFAAQRAAHKSNPHLWEFPGGKIEPGENAADTVVREMQEELNITVRPLKPFEPALIQTPALRLHPWYCEITAGKLVLRDHQQYQWIALHQWQQFSWTAPDIALLQQLTAS